MADAHDRGAASSMSTATLDTAAANAERIQMPADELARFLNSFDSGDGCWPWKRPNRTGYGTFGFNARHFTAYRLSYELFVGPIPDGLHIDHKCENKACVNPDHLEPVQQWVNAVRSRSKDVLPSVWYDRTNPGHPRIKDVWGRIYKNRAVRVEVVGTCPGSPTVTIRYTSTRGRREIDLGQLLSEWRLLSRWPGLDPTHSSDV
jgi:hypothetical protein